MKRLLIPLLVGLALLGMVTVGEAAGNKLWGFTALVGSAAGALDAIPIASLTGGDIAIGTVSNVLYIYQFNAAATDAESSPNYIRPDDYSSAGVWYLTSHSATSVSTTAAAATGGYVRLAEGTDNGTDYSSITGAADAGTTAAFTFAGSATNENLTITIGATDSNAATIASTTGALLTITPATTITGTLTLSSQLNLMSTNADPATTAGGIKHDSTDTGSNSGGTLKWYDGAQVRSVVDTGTNYTIITKTEFLPIRYAENGSSPPDAAAAVTGKVIIARNFAEGEDVAFFWVVPNDYIGAGPVKYRVHYALSTDGEANDTATFSMTGCIVANSADIACSAGTALTISDEIGTDDDQYQYMVTDYSAESNADWGATAGGLVKLAFSYAAAGDYTHDVLVIGIELKYKAKVMGFADY